MQELNNWDMDTIGYIRRAAEVRLEEAEQQAKDFIEASNNAIGKTTRHEMLGEARYYFGQASAYQTIVGLCRQMERDNIEALLATLEEAEIIGKQKGCHHENYSNSLEDCQAHQQENCYFRTCDNCNAPIEHLAPQN